MSRNLSDLWFYSLGSLDMVQNLIRTFVLHPTMKEGRNERVHTDREERETEPTLLLGSHPPSPWQLTHLYNNGITLSMRAKVSWPHHSYKPSS
jgi:hypothetical protein